MACAVAVMAVDTSLAAYVAWREDENVRWRAYSCVVGFGGMVYPRPAYLGVEPAVASWPGFD